MRSSQSWLCIAAALLHQVLAASAQLIGPVGPTTPLASKTKLCNVLDYGGRADNATNIAPALEAAFTHCVLRHSRSRLYVPKGDYLTTESIMLSNGTNWAFQLDGSIIA